MDLDGLSMEDIASRITDAGFEVEEIIPMSQGTNLVIGEVLTCKPHPDSDHLHVTTVNVGDEVLNIVCGAPNVAAGQKVIVAKPGAKLPGGEIKKGSIRGQESNGMICALFELGVDKHMLSQAQLDGIEVLPEDAPIGNTDPLGYLGYNDTVLDISLTPNRADCQSAFNMAMETGAILNKEVKLPDFEGAASAGSDVETDLHVSSETDGCPLFFGKLIGSLTIKESPKWMKELLRASGIHSINNVVDISNIVMLETAQPMHFYDARAIADYEITVKDGFHEKYTALDGVEYQLEPEDVVITNHGKPIGIAGIMGGDDSKIEEDTTSLIIECAAFDHVRIRTTARRLSLNTESSIRYQKGIEPLAARKALDRALQLLIEYADAKEIEKTVMFGSENYEPKTIEVRWDRINERLGTDFSIDEITDILDRLHFEPSVDGEILRVNVPSWRTDVSGLADLSEEVIRMAGYDRLPSTLPLMEMTEGKLNPEQKMTRFTRQMLLENGLQDAVTYTLVSDDKNSDAILSAGEAYVLPTPLSEERKVIRTSVLPSLLEGAAYNISRGMKDIALFEISNLSAKDRMERHLAIVMKGSLENLRWAHYEKQADFYTLKGLIEEYLERLGINPARISFRPNKKDTEHFHPYRSAEIYLGKDLIGLMGDIHPAYAQKTKTGEAVMAELNLTKILAAKKSKIRFSPVSRYPSVSRDIALVMKKDVPASMITDIIERSGKAGKENIVRDVEIFDVYTGEHVGQDEVSLAVNITFQSDQKTLSEEDINEAMNRILAEIEKKTKAVLRR